MEIWELLTKDRTPAGIDHVRGEEMPEGCYHLVVQAWLKNSRGEYLISQRAASRPIFPLMWECVGGSAVKGEDSLTAAIREVKEEVGVDVTPETGKLLFSQRRDMIRGKRYSDFVDVWLFEYDGPVSLDNATTDEVAQVRWMNREEIQALYDRGELVFFLDYFFTQVDIP